MTFKSNHSTQGTSLLEVLIAIVVLSVGLLGIAGLQLTGMRFTSNANLRFQAQLQVNDMADRIRANSIGEQAGNYNNISGLGSNPGCISTGCTPAQMATTDAFQWNTANAALLPSGTGTVVGNGTTFTITINWTELDPTGAVTKSFVLSVRP